MEFQLQQMERKVARAGGVRSEEETRALNARIEKLAGVLEGVNGEHSMLLEQVSRQRYLPFIAGKLEGPSLRKAGRESSDVVRRLRTLPWCTTTHKT